MDKELKAKWVEALRSGEYRQGHAKLVTSDGLHFCCLGVACKIGAAGFPSELSSEVTAAAQVARDLSIHPVARDTLIRMNDFEKRSFSEIADYIEENL